MPYSFSVKPTDPEVFILPASLVDKHMHSADLTDLRVILYIFRNRDSLDLSMLRSDLALSEGELERALSFWTDSGVLLLDKDEYSFSPGVYSRVSAGPIKTQKRPEYRPSDINRSLKESASLKSMFEAVEKRIGKLLSQTELSLVFSLVDWYGFSPDTVYMIVDFCCEIGKTSVRYMEKVAMDLDEKGLKTAAAVASHFDGVRRRMSDEGKVKSIFGIGERNLTPTEKSMVETWFSDWGFSPEMITIAYEKTVDQIGKMNFKYTNSILERWKKENISSPEAARGEKSPKKAGKAKKNEESPSFDLGEFEKWTYFHLSDSEKDE